MKKIKLHGKYAIDKYSHVLVDDMYYEWLNRYYWIAHQAGSNSNMIYAAADIWTPTGKQWFRMHRLVANASPTKLVDHIDGNTINNQASNLRLATHTENGQNKHVSKFKGCSWDGRSKVWWGRIKVSGKQIGLGTYDTERDCGIAYNIAADKYFGKFASFNKIRDWRTLTPKPHVKIHNPHQSNNKSGYVGVSYHKSTDKWQATFNKKYLGTFLTIEEAANARSTAELEYAKV